MVIQNGEKCYQFQIRKDNPYRKPSADGKQPSGANQNSLSYDRIFSDLSASNDDELLNISAIGSSRTGGNEKSNKVRERIFGFCTICSHAKVSLKEIVKCRKDVKSSLFVAICL